MILSGSIYGHTENAAEALASRLYDLGIKGVKIYDVSKTHPSYIVAEAFKFSHIVIAAATYNAGIFTPMETVLLDLKAHNLKNRTVGLIYNGSWVPVTEKVFTNIFETMSGIQMLEHSVKIMSTLKPHQEDEIEAMAQEIRASIPQTKQETNAMFKINYGLYLLSAKDENKAVEAVVEMINSSDVNVFEELVKQSDFLFPFVKDNVCKRFEKSLRASNYKNLLNFLNVYSQDYDRVFASAFKVFGNEEIKPVMLDLLKNGSTAQKTYATRFYELSPDLLAVKELIQNAFDEDENLADASASALGVLNEQKSYLIALEKLNSDDDFETLKGLNLTPRLRRT